MWELESNGTYRCLLSVGTSTAGSRRFENGPKHFFPLSPSQHLPKHFFKRLSRHLFKRLSKYAPGK
jgi:hypothetical protein